MTRLTGSDAVAFAKIGLGHVRREFPNKLDHVMVTADDAATPHALHPVFYGSFDWHSCVHAYWMLARLLRRFPDFALAPAVRDLFATHLTTDLVAVECAYFERPSAQGFERPYGWAWLLKLATELHAFPNEPWAEALSPLAAIVVSRFRAFLPLATYPIRAGTHGNSAFALALASNYAIATADVAFTALLKTSALRWFGGDADCQAWEPGGDDFLSPALVEAECMRRLSPTKDFAAWLDGFLPNLAERRPETLFVPALVTDRTDGKLAHLDGFNLSRAWCWRSLAASLRDGDPRRQLMLDSAVAHFAASAPHLSGHYMGEHWLATFALLALDEAERGGV